MTDIQFELFRAIRYFVIGEESNDIGFVILLDIIPKLPDDIAAQMYEDLFEQGLLYQLSNEAVEKLPEETNTKEEEELHKYMEAFNKLFEVHLKSYKERKLAAIKRKLLKKLGDRAKSPSFKRNYVFSSKLKRFVRRKKPLSMQTLRKKQKLMKKLHKKGSFRTHQKQAVKLAKKHPIHV